MKMKLTVMTLAAITAIGIQTANAGNVAWSVGISPGGVAVGIAGGPWVPGPVYTPPPVYVQPPPVYVQPPPVVVAPPPVCVAPPRVYVPAPLCAVPHPLFGLRLNIFGGHHHHR